MITIRAAILSDAKRLAELAETTFRETFAEQNNPQDMQLHCQSSFAESIQAAEIADPEIVTLVAEAEEQLVAYAQLRWRKAPAGVSGQFPGEIQRLYLAKSQHGKGLAQELMLACLAAFESRQTDTVWLGVWEKNPRAIAFYRKFDFREVGAHVFPLGEDPQRDIIMARVSQGSVNNS